MDQHDQYIAQLMSTLCVLSHVSKTCRHENVTVINLNDAAFLLMGFIAIESRMPSSLLELATWSETHDKKSGLILA